MSLLGGIIGAVGSLFGGSKKQETTSSVDYKKMAREATEAGFNPLTAIRNGGSAGFTTTTGPSISNTPEILSNLGGILGDALGDKLDPIQAKRREIDTLLVDRQLRQLKEGPQVPGRLMTPRTFEGVKVSQQIVPRLSASTPKAASVPAAYDLGNPNGYEQSDAKKMNYGNQSWWKSNPWLPAAEAVEDDLGDVAGSLYGAPKLAVDLGYNLGRWSLMGRDDWRKRQPALSRARAASRAGATMGGMYRKPYLPKGGAGGGW